MRLWHEDLIKKLPRQQLLGQHRECCALRGNGWGKPHATVNYVFDYPKGYLYDYHMLIIDEMENRGYSVDENWKVPIYRGKSCEPLAVYHKHDHKDKIYREHDSDYMRECVENLMGKGVVLSGSLW